MSLTLQSFVSFALVGTFSIASAASSAIGVVKARGDFQIDKARVYRLGTLFEGNAIETEKVASELQLNGGAQLLLGSGSRGLVYRDHMILERGKGRLTGASKYRIEARSLRISTAGPDSAVQVALGKANHVQVAVLSGAAQVANAQGVLVANVVPGKALDLEPQQGAAAPARLTGCLERKDGRFILTDETANVTVELQGAGLDKQVGNVMEATGAAIPGATPAAGATQVIQVSEMKATGRKCTGVPGAAAAPAAGTVAAVALSTAAKAAIIGGVAAAATVGGFAAAGSFEDEKAPASP